MTLARIFFELWNCRPEAAEGEPMLFKIEDERELCAEADVRSRRINAELDTH